VDATSLLAELTPTVERLLDRHRRTCKPWYPHEAVPWSLGRDFDRDEEWDGAAYPLPAAVRSALFVNLLTEDNLPYYFGTIDRAFGAAGPWGEWNRRWVAEEGRHSIAIRDFLIVTRAIDPVELEDARMHQVTAGVVPEPPTPVDTFVYVAFQELATRLAHRNTGRALLESGPEGPAARAGYDVMARVATDENFHFLFYRDLTTAALALDPSAVVQALERQVTAFEMPGVGIPGFKEHAAAIAHAGIYNVEQHYEQVLLPLLRHWGVHFLEGLDTEASRARDRLISHVERVERVARRVRERRNAASRSTAPPSAA
jgi:acyl-[acyl-carrier-protein] desaturase